MALAALFVLSTPFMGAHPAHAAVDHAILMSTGAGFTQGDISYYVYYMDGGTLVEPSGDELAIGTTTTQQGLIDKIKAAVVVYGQSQGYTAISSSNVSLPWTSAADVTAAVSAATSSFINPHAYEGTTNRTNAFPVFKSATVSSGTAVFNLTTDGTSGGTALFPNGVIADSVSPSVSDATASYQMAWVFTNANKTLTVTANKLTTANILTGLLGQAAANAAVVKLSVWGY